MDRFVFCHQDFTIFDSVLLVCRLETWEVILALPGLIELKSIRLRKMGQNENQI